MIPEGTSRRLDENQRVEIGIIVDGSDSRISSVAGGYAAQILAGFNERRLADVQQMLERAPGVEASVRVLYNPSLRAVNSMIPGLMATILMISIASVMSQAVVRERESGTLEQMFTTPITRGEYIVGKMTPYVIISSLQIAVVAAVGRLLVPRAVHRQRLGRLARPRAVRVHDARHRPARLARLAHPAAGPADGDVHPHPVLRAVRLHLPDRGDAAGDRAAHLLHPAALRGPGPAAGWLKGSSPLELWRRCSRWWLFSVVDLHAWPC